MCASITRQIRRRAESEAALLEIQQDVHGLGLRVRSQQMSDAGKVHLRILKHFLGSAVYKVFDKGIVENVAASEFPVGQQLALRIQ